ncbi:hypothetical protein VP01_1946g2, partial [Puccinia sorghi]
MAAEAAAQLDLLAQLPSDSSSHTLYRPLSSNRPLPYIPPSPNAPSRDPNAMDVDAVQTLSRSLLDSSRNLCRSRNLCFRCLQPIVPGSHRKAFIERSRAPRPAQVSMVSPSLSPDSLPPAPTPLAFQTQSIPEEDRPLSADLHGDFDEHYEDYDAADCATADVASVQIRLNCSSGGRILVPATFKAQ